MAATDPTGYLSIPLELIRGNSWKRPVRMASTGNLTLSGLQTIDGVVGAAGDRVLAKDQTTGAQRGIYVMASGAWIRAFDMDQDLSTAVPAEEIAGAFVFVEEGAANGGKLFYSTNVGGGSLGSTTITFAEWPTGTDVTVQDEGTPLATVADTLNFTGAGVTATGTGGTKTINVPGGATSSDASVWKPVMATNPNIITADGAVVWVPLVTVDGEAIMALVPNS